MEESLRGLLLKRVAYGEADLILTFLSRERGLVSCFGRSARRQKRAWSGLLSPGNTLEIELSTRRQTGLPTLKHLRLGKDRSQKLATPATLARAAYYLDLAIRVTVEGAPASDFLDRLELALDHIEEPGVSRFMEWASVDQLGVLPPLDHCGECGAEFGDSGGRLAPGGGGMFCLACGGQGQRVAGQTLHHLRALSQGQWRMENEAERDLAKLLGQILFHQLGVLESRRQAARYAAL